MLPSIFVDLYPPVSVDDIDMAIANLEHIKHKILTHESDLHWVGE